MNLDRRLSAALHALLHMAGRARPVTSDELGRCIQANPVVVRRTMAGLRSAGLVRAEKGRGGGWSIQRELSEISVRDVHAALGAPSLVAVGLRHRNPECLVERAVRSTLESAVIEAEALLLDRLGMVSLAQLADDVHHRGRSHEHHHHIHLLSE